MRKLIHLFFLLKMMIQTQVFSDDNYDKFCRGNPRICKKIVTLMEFN